MAEGLNSRVFPGEHLMLSVVEIAPGSVSPVHSHLNDIFSPPREEYKKAGSGYE
jgi:quercetin dioxygenase-like cupin family protein